MMTSSFAPRWLASLCLASLLTAHAPVVSAQAKKPPAVSEAAKKHFQAGVDFLTDPDGARYEEALREFRAAYADSPSWKILGNLGLSALKLERNGEALDAYERYLKEGGKDIEAAERAQIEKDLRLLRSSSTPLTLSAQGVSGDVELIDQRPKPNGTSALNTYTVAAGKPLALLVQSGRHVFTAKSGGQQVTWETELAPEKAADHTFTFGAKPASTATTSTAAPPTTTTPPTTAETTPRGMSTLRLAGIGTAGLGGALLIGGVVTGLIGKGKLSTLEDSCVNKQCPTDKRADADSIETLQTTTNVLLIAGGVLAAAGVTMIVVGKTPESSTARLGHPTVSIAPQLGPQGGGVWAIGQF